MTAHEKRLFEMQLNATKYNLENAKKRNDPESIEEYETKLKEIYNEMEVYR